MLGWVKCVKWLILLTIWQLASLEYLLAEPPAISNPSLAEFQLELIEGESQSVSLELVSDQELVLAGASQRTIPTTNVVAFRTKRNPIDWNRRAAVIWLSNGDRIIAEPVAADDDGLTARWVHFSTKEELRIPLERVSAICLKMPGTVKARRNFFGKLATHSLPGDIVWLTSGDRFAGEFSGLSETSGHLHSETGDLSIRREQLACVQFDPQLIATDPPASPRFLLSLSDGSLITAQNFRLTSTQLTFLMFPGETITLPAEAMLGCQVFSDRVQPVSELKPTHVRFTPFLSREWPWVKNRNVLHGPLQLRGREFGTGIGVHSQMSLTYDLGETDQEFRATVGIDDEAEGQGDAVFSVSVDDRVVWKSPNLTGKSPPVSLPSINVQKGKRLTLTVEFGAFGDVADHADWCDAVLIRK